MIRRAPASVLTTALLIALAPACSAGA